MNPALADAVRTLRDGGLVGFPTETVYGVGADADNPQAVRRLMEAKDRPLGQPITVHLGPSADPEAWAHVSPVAWRAIHALWPGSLTLILPARARVISEVTGGGESVGLRVPSNVVAMELLDAFGAGVAGSSANRRGQPAPSNRSEARAALGAYLDVALEARDDAVGVASTVLSLVGRPMLLREGAVDRGTLQDAIGVAIEPAAP